MPLAVWCPVCVGMGQRKPGTRLSRWQSAGRVAAAGLEIPTVSFLFEV